MRQATTFNYRNRLLSGQGLSKDNYYVSLMDSGALSDVFQLFEVKTISDITNWMIPDTKIDVVVSSGTTLSWSNPITTAYGLVTYGSDDIVICFIDFEQSYSSDFSIPFNTINDIVQRVI